MKFDRAKLSAHLVLPAERSLWEAYKSWLVSAGAICLIVVIGLAFKSVGETSEITDPPAIFSVDLPSWLAPLEPLARLPLWGQAAVVSAGVAGFLLVVPMVFRWVWKLGESAKE